MKIIGVIPARYDSKRLLGKPLIDINGKPLIQVTYEAVLSSKLFDSVLITTESEKIKKIAHKFGATCIMTSKKCRNGTERCAELVKMIDDEIKNSDLIINIQCDEPFVQTKHLFRIINLLKSGCQIGTIISDIQDSEIKDNSVVKTQLNKNNVAINFSRSESDFINLQTIYKHVGIYGYNKKTLLTIANLQPTKNERIEKLEQLRWMDYDYEISCTIIKENLTSINTVEDLEKVVKKNI